MNLKETLNENLSILNKELIIIEKANQKQISILLKEFEKKLLEDLIVVFNDSKKVKQIIKENFIENLKDISLKLDENIYNALIDINDSAKDIILFMIDNPVVSSKAMTKVEKVYDEKLKLINPFTEDFRTSYKKNFDLLIYYLSTNFKLKYDVNNYKYIEKIIDINKKYYLNEIIKILNSKKKDNYVLFKKHLVSFVKSLDTSINEIKEYNFNEINEYVLSVLEIYNKTQIDKYLKMNYDYITNEIDTMHESVLKEEKIKETKTTTREKLLLKDYLLNFNNTLFSKAYKCLNDMSSVVGLEKDKAREKLNEYSDSIYAIYDLEYNFDKQFNEYKLTLLKKKNLVTTQKTIDDVIQIINESKEKIIENIKSNLSTMFKES